MTSGGSNFKDLSGIVFGQLTVIKRVDNIGTRVRYLVFCSCGRSEKFCVDRGHLKNGDTTACRICQYEKIGRARFQNLTGKVFGNLTVIKQSNYYVSPKGEVKAKWICRCSCGRSDDFSVIGNDLKQGKTSRCEICRFEMCGKSTFQDLSGMNFGQLKVIRRATDYTSPEGRKIVRWVCRCDCGRNDEFIARADSLNIGHVTSCSKCGRERISKTTESNLASELKKHFSNKYLKTEIEYQVFVNPETGYNLPYDIYLPSGNNSKINGIYIEIHGQQHYRFVPFWHKTKEKFEYNKKLDRMKKKFAKKNGTYIEIDLRKIKTMEQAIKYIDKILLG